MKNQTHRVKNLLDFVSLNCETSAHGSWRGMGESPILFAR